MSDAPERKNLIETVGDKIGECLPERYRTEKVAYRLGSICGLVSGFFFGRAIVRLLFPNNKENEK